MSDDRRTNAPLSHDEARELLAPYAVGALPAEEALELEAVLSDWPEGRAELAELIQVADSLMVAGAEELTPPMSLEARIIAEARGEKSGGATRIRFRRMAPIASPWRRVAPYAMAASFAIVAIVFGVMAFDDDTPAQGVFHRVSTEVGAGGDAAAYVVYPGDTPLAIFFSNLEPAPSGAAYVLWTLRGDGSATATASFDSSGPADRPSVWLGRGEGGVVGFAVTLEPLGDLPTDPPDLDAVLFTFSSSE